MPRRGYQLSGVSGQTAHIPPSSDTTGSVNDVKTQATSVIPATANERIQARRSVRELLKVVAASVRSLVAWGYFPWLIVAVGIVFRVVRYLHDRSLWLDESQLALNVMSRSYSHLFGALNFDQAAPVGFLMLEKLATSVFGDSERAFRLVPFLAGLASVVVFWRVASRFLDRASALLALAFFAFLVPLIYYSAETKPYSLDVLAALVLLWLFDRAVHSDRRGRWAIVFAIAGVILPWFAYGSLFVLAGTGATLLLVAAIRRDRRAMVLMSFAIAAWLVAFAVEYKTSTSHSHHLLAAVANQNVAGHSSVLKNLYIIFSQPGGVPRTLIGLTAMLVLVGAAALGREAWPRLGALGLTAIAAVLAAIAGRYPLAGRWVLYLLPLAVLLLARGGVALVRSTRMPARLAPIGFVTLLLVAPAWTSSRELVRLPTAEAGTPSTLQPTEHLLARLTDVWHPGDTLYVSVKSQYAFRYYLTCSDCNPRRAQEARLWPFHPIPGRSQTAPALLPDRRSLVVGSSPGLLDNYIDDFERLRSRSRVWFLFTHTPPVDEGTLEWWLNREGRQIMAIREGAAALLLYQFRS
jgi:dolichyl-phosphate-mannose-protein mannosyltransferase